MNFTSPSELTQHVVRSLAYRLALGPQHLEAQLAKSFPLTSRKWGLSIEIQAPEVDLQEAQNRILLRSNFTVSLGNQPLADGATEVAGTLVYAAEEGAFYVDQPELTRLDLLSIPDSYTRPVRGLLTGALSILLQDTPIFQFNDHDWRHRLARKLVKNVKVHRGKLRIRLGLGPSGQPQPLAESVPPRQ